MKILGDKINYDAHKNQNISDPTVLNWKQISDHKKKQTHCLIVVVFVVVGFWGFFFVFFYLFIYYYYFFFNMPSFGKLDFFIYFYFYYYFNMPSFGKSDEKVKTNKKKKKTNNRDLITRTKTGTIWKIAQSAIQHV